jgi:multidrug efflux pump subunit AcrA (membrane-fusion protein)
MKRYSDSLSLIVLGCFSLAAGAQETLRSVTVSQPLTRQTDSIDFDGRVSPVDPIEVRSPQSGVIGKVACKLGEAVKKGEVLFEFDPVWFQKELQQTEELVARLNTEWKRRKTNAEDARKLAANTNPTDLTKKLGEQLTKIKEPLEKAQADSLAALKAGLPATLREEVQEMRNGLERTVRLVKARTGPAFDAAIDESQEKLLGSTARILQFPGDWKKDGAGKQLTASLESLREAIDGASILSRARSQAGVDALTAEADIAGVKLLGAERELEAAKKERRETSIRARADGTIIQLGVASGDRVSAGVSASTLLCTIAPTTPVRVTFGVDPKTFDYLQALKRDGKIKADSLSDVPVRVGLPGKKDFPHLGALDVIDNQMDAKTKRSRFEAIVPNAGGALTPALTARKAEDRMVRVRLTLGPARDLLLVPERAVITDPQGKTHLLVVNKMDRVEGRTVQIGALYSGLRVIETGLKPEEWVIVAVQRRERSPDDKTLSPEDFTSNVTFAGVRLGSTVKPIRAELPTPEEDKEKPRN